jgi:hypothetical protein
MKNIAIQKLGLPGLLFAASLITTTARAVDVTVGPENSYAAYMNVFELTANGGGYVFGSAWGVPDIATFTAGAPPLKIAPVFVNDTSPFWYVGGGAPGNPGNKNMEALVYIESNGPLSGVTVDFSASVLSYTLSPSHVVTAFIRDFAPDFSSFSEAAQVLTGTGDFMISLNTINDPLRHVQYGFKMVGANAWITDVPSFGSVEIGTIAIPEPSTYGLIGAGVIGVFALCSRRRRES